MFQKAFLNSVEIAAGKWEGICWLLLEYYMGIRIEDNYFGGNCIDEKYG
ncbi:hypothetical protein [uncultured Clostridium sp.]|nr:hypothetical protein [uncultured Clostridium sp.]